MLISLFLTVSIFITFALMTLAFEMWEEAPEYGIKGRVIRWLCSVMCPIIGLACTAALAVIA